jgi:flagella basal body P-ring formation protein FlgA
MISLAAVLLAGVTVTMPMEAKTHGTEIELGEVARVECADAELAERARAVSLGYAPTPGYSRLIRVDQAQQALAKALPGVQVTFVGQMACRVTPEVTLVPAADIQNAARAELSRQLEGLDVEVVLAGRFEGIEVPAGAGEWQLRVRENQRVLSTGSTSVPVQVIVDGAPYRTVWTNWRIQVYERVPVLKRGVRSGETLGPELFAVKRTAVRGSGAERPLNGAMVLGAIAARDLPAGHPVTGLDVHRPAVIRGGKAIVLEVKKGPIAARMPATALEAGAIGDRIRIRTDEGREMSGTVVGRDVVRVELGS